MIENVKQILMGHVSPETAYLIDDYPYGFTLRCKMRCWLEFKPGRGCRMMWQTSNPKKSGEVWNKPKASTYMLFGGCMYLDEKGHVQWSGAHVYMTAAELQAWMDQFGAGLPPLARPAAERWLAAKKAYEERTQGAA